MTLPGLLLYHLDHLHRVVNMSISVKVVSRYPNGGKRVTTALLGRFPGT